MNIQVQIGMLAAVGMLALGPSPAHAEAEILLGLIPGKEVLGQRGNANGGDRLQAYLENSLLFGLRLGSEGEHFGLDIQYAVALSEVEVENLEGVDFPNHGNGPYFLSSHWTWTPEKRWFFEPYLQGGAGLSLVFVDLDNAGYRRGHDNGQETYWVPYWEVGAGAKIDLPKPDWLLDVRYSFLQSIGGGTIEFDGMSLITLGVGWRF